MYQESQALGYGAFVDPRFSILLSHSGPRFLLLWSVLTRCPTLCVLCRVCSDAVCLLSGRPTSSFLPSRRRGDGPYASIGRLSRAPDFVALARRSRYLTIVGVCYPIMSSRHQKKRILCMSGKRRFDRAVHRFLCCLHTHSNRRNACVVSLHSGCPLKCDGRIHGRVQRQRARNVVF